jgi:hypothetical protein
MNIALYTRYPGPTDSNPLLFFNFWQICQLAGNQGTPIILDFHIDCISPVQIDNRCIIIQIN